MVRESERRATQGQIAICEATTLKSKVGNTTTSQIRSTTAAEWRFHEGLSYTARHGQRDAAEDDNCLVRVLYDESNVKHE